MQSYIDELVNNMSRSMTVIKQDYIIGYKRGYKVGYRMGYFAGTRSGSDDGSQDAQDWKYSLREKMRRCMQSGNCPQ